MKIKISSHRHCQKQTQIKIGLCTAMLGARYHECHFVPDDNDNGGTDRVDSTVKTLVSQTVCLF